MKYFANISVLLVCCLLLAGCREKPGGEIYLISSEAGAEAPAAGTEVTEATEERRQTATQNGSIVIYVCGEVNVPGVYVIPEGSRICDALEAAGGFTEAAGTDYWNLARLLTDGEMIYFPTRAEAKERQSAAAEAESAKDADGRVNLNTATLDELMTLPGIGETRGRAILSYRREHGAFSGKEDVMLVTGIGSAVFDGMRDYITVD